MVLWARDATLQRLQRHVTAVSEHQQFATTKIGTHIAAAASSSQRQRQAHTLPECASWERCVTRLLLAGKVAYTTLGCMAKPRCLIRSLTHLIPCARQVVGCASRWASCQQVATDASYSDPSQIPRDLSSFHFQFTFLATGSFCWNFQIGVLVVLRFPVELHIKRAIFPSRRPSVS